MPLIKTILIGFLSLLILIATIMVAFIFIGFLTLFWKEILVALVVSMVLGLVINLAVKEEVTHK